MPRANRHFLLGRVWHMTHRDHAVGSLALVDKVKSELGVKAMHRKVAPVNGTYTLREPSETYGGYFGSANDALKPENTISWEENADSDQTSPGPTRSSKLNQTRREAARWLGEKLGSDNIFVDAALSSSNLREVLIEKVFSPCSTV